MNIIYEDKDIIVIEKPAGMPVQTGKIAQKDLVSELKIYLHEKCNGETYLGIIHRLDQPVRGILVFALNKITAGELGRQIADEGFDKRYYAVVEGIVDVKGKTVLEDYLIKTRDNMAKVVDKSYKDAKKAILEYSVIKTDMNRQRTLLDIELMTGRFHQIRAQLSNMGHPIVGDLRYGAGSCENGLPDRAIGLCAYHLGFKHPGTGRRMDFEIAFETDKYRVKNLSVE